MNDHERHWMLTPPGDIKSAVPMGIEFVHNDYVLGILKPSDGAPDDVVAIIDLDGREVIPMTKERLEWLVKWSTDRLAELEES